MSYADSSAASNEAPTRLGASPRRLKEVSGRVSTRLGLERQLDLSWARPHRCQIAAPAFLPSRKFPVGWAIAPAPSRNNPAPHLPAGSATAARPSARAFLDRSFAACESRLPDETAKHPRRQHAIQVAGTPSHRPTSKTSGQMSQPPHPFPALPHPPPTPPA